jgi:hypothetical protein
MKKQIAACMAASLAILLATVCFAGIRAAGKYSGVVVFDRWGGCTLYGGVYVMYVSEGVKEQLRPYAGKCVEIDATQVEQPINPGDGLIKKFTMVGPAPPARDWQSPQGLKLTVSRAFEDGHAPEFVIRVENAGEKPALVRMESLAPTLLAAKKNGVGLLSPADGPSTAVVTRQGFWIGGTYGARMEGSNPTWQWKVVAPRTLEEKVALDPKAAFEIRLSFTLPPGEYEFLAGYGGGVNEGQCIASNLVGFDVRKDGTAMVAKTAGK